jgi:hypothetical protein
MVAAVRRGDPARFAHVEALVGKMGAEMFFGAKQARMFAEWAGDELATIERAFRRWAQDKPEAALEGALRWFGTPALRWDWVLSTLDALDERKEEGDRAAQRKLAAIGRALASVRDRGRQKSAGAERMGRLRPPLKAYVKNLRKNPRTPIPSELRLAGIRKDWVLKVIRGEPNFTDVMVTDAILGKLEGVDPRSVRPLIARAKRANKS